MQQYFTGTVSHNTVTVDEKSQMLKGSRFIWYYWTQAQKVNLVETETNYLFEGQVSAFKYLNSNAMHIRKIKKVKGKKEWEVYDRIDNLPNMNKKQIFIYCIVILVFISFSKERLIAFPSINSP